MRRKPTLLKRDADASALRKAVQQSDPKALSDALPEQDTSERRMFLFYQDEGGIRATGDTNEDLGVIYYLVSLGFGLALAGERGLMNALLSQGIIDILTPYTFIKKAEHFFKGLKHDPVSACLVLLSRSLERS
jgi:1-phosphatidylinositol-4-phosphate 5-kinase